ncbi:MAG: hypothetical protein IT429_25525, partial [Gemmataceae bacterium]|nr:hypothetical protein [Gemmataceae bacterium]
MTRRIRRPGGQGSLFKRAEGGPWRAAYRDHEGRRRETSTRTTDRAAAERILAKMVAGAALRREGVIDPRADALADHGRKPLSQHLDDYASVMRSRGGSERHIAST